MLILCIYISWFLYVSTVKDLKSRLVPKTLNFLEKIRRADVCETMLSDYQDKLKSFITGDET